MTFLGNHHPVETVTREYINAVIASEESPFLPRQSPEHASPRPSGCAVAYRVFTTL